MKENGPESLGAGRYEVIEPVGSGGMAVVYRARDQWLQREVALKVLTPAGARSANTRTRFLQEARTMASLDHPHVVRVLDVGRDGQTYFLAMELAVGGSISSYIKAFGTRPTRESLSLIYQVLLGLGYAHDAGLVHRDIKPQNLLLTHGLNPEADAKAELFSPRQQVKLADFGIAKHLHAAEQKRLTGAGDTLGTLAYMAPEQRADPRDARPETDIYGVGASLYIMATGRSPFDLAIADIDPTGVQRLPRALREVVTRATAERPEDRFGSAKEMGEAVANAWDEVGPDAEGVSSTASEAAGITIAVPLDDDETE